MRRLRPSRVARRLLFLVDAETNHSTGVRAAAALVPVLSRMPRLRVIDPRLNQEAWGIVFPNPVGLGAGYDKWGRAIPAWHALGFGFAEIGTVTPSAQEGNPKPRLFRLPSDEAIINRMGFNNDGAPATAHRLAAVARQGWLRRIPLGVNIGKMKHTPAEDAARDYVNALERLWLHASYIAVNVSSPNTPGLRDLQESSQLGGILEAVISLNRDKASVTRQRVRPVLVKVAPDLSDDQFDAVVDLVRSVGADGMIVSNTTIARDDLQSPSHLTSESGGLSGRPLAARSHSLLERAVARAPEVPIISVGGIFSPDDAWDRLRAGARLVQLWTGLVYEGPTLAARINRGLLRRMDREGIEGVHELAPQSVRDARR